MKTFRVLVAVGVLALVGRASGQTLTNLYSFTGHEDGDVPLAGLIQGSDGNFYGTTIFGGYVTGGAVPSGYGTVFRISPNGSMARIYAFSGAYATPSDGDDPNAPVIQGRDGNFYGTTLYGGTGPSDADDGCGIVFRVSPAGVETNLYSFPYYVNGGFPTAGLVQGYDGNFYGTTSSGGAYAYSGGSFGTVFRISPSGVLTTLYSFSNSPSDGAVPSQLGLVQGSDSNLYGTTQGVSWWTGNATGTVFRISPSGVFTNLYSFLGQSNGYFPNGGLVQGTDGNFYGTTGYGGTNGGYGTMFRISPTGTFTSVHSFSQSDGEGPSALVLGSDGNFYGITGAGGAYSNGTVFRISASGSLTVLQSVVSAPAFNGLMQGSDGNFYGTTQQGGTYSNGSVFRFAIPLNPPANQISAVQSAGSNAVLTVPSVAGETYQLQFSPSMNPTNWSNVAGVCVSNSIGAALTVTNFGGATGAQGFYRFAITP